MNVLVIGGNGMAGHMLLRFLSQTGDYSLYYTVREGGQSARSSLPGAGLYLDVTDGDKLETLIDAVRPDVIVNGAGILNDSARRRTVEAYQVNGLLPHRLARAAERIGSRLIHISTDCVFAGTRGAYEERHVPDGDSVYALTKALGEVHEAPHLTVRTSIIGPEIRPNGIGLLSWFLHQRGPVKGFVKVPWNGVTTLELARFIKHAIDRGEALSGLVHLTAPEAVSKYELLGFFAQTFGRDDVVIQPDDAIAIDRTLRSTRSDLGYTVPHYAAMLQELREWMPEPL